MGTRVELTEVDYLDIEDALLASAKGRAFLREHARKSQSVSLETVRRVLEEFRDETQTNPTLALQTNAELRLEVLRGELRDMSASIAEARRQIAALQPQEGGNNRILAATEELDAIVMATERATSDILNAAERLIESQRKALGSGDLAELAAVVEAQATNILMACSFQDITGQRTTKVVNVLRYIEQRIHAMIAIWGIDGDQHLVSADHVVGSDHRPDAHLLNGPQLPGQGVGQEDVDAILSAASDVVAGSSKGGRSKKRDGSNQSGAAVSPMGGVADASLAQDDIDSLFN
jgi:chemotaxis regulatin CheY-phosphate phosphatase CheZ